MLVCSLANVYKLFVSNDARARPKHVFVFCIRKDDIVMDITKHMDNLTNNIDFNLDCW